MRPNRSLFAPLLLILIGVLLLLHNFRPEFPFWDLVARYWPLVLVVWGLAKLAGALQRPRAGETPWRPSLTIGEFFLALLIVAAGLSASQWVRVRGEIPWGQMGFDWPWSERFTFTQELKHDIPANASVYFESYAGDVRVTGADTKELTVTVSKQVRSTSEPEARKLADSLQPEIVQNGNSLTIRMPNNPQFRADLQVSVPKKTPLQFDVRRGSIQASDIIGDISGNVDRGDAAVSNIEGNVRLQLRRGSLSAQNVKGNVELEGRGSDVQVADVTGQLLVRGEYSGASDYARIAQGVKFTSSRTDMEIQKLPGRLEMTIGSLSIKQPDGAVTINTQNKDIRVEDFNERVQVTDRGASVELSTTRLPLKDIEVENHSGPIEVSLPPRSEFQVDATARRGEVESDFGPLETETGTENGHASGRVGKGGGNLKLTTSYGSIRLRKLGSEITAPDAPKPPKAPAPPRSGIAGRAWPGPGELHDSFARLESLQGVDRALQARERARKSQEQTRQRLAVVERRASERLAAAEKRINRVQ